MNKNWLLITAMTMGAFLPTTAQERGNKEEKGVRLDATYTADVAGNVAGGIKKGGAYIGLAEMGVGVDFGQVGIWKGGQLRIAGQASHGDNPSSTLTGDFQVFDNNEAGTHIYLKEVWFAQRIDKLHVAAGIMDLNADYSVCEAAGNYINSSFGTHAVLMHNGQAPIYPLTGLGAHIRWEINKNFAWQAAVFDGEMTAFGEGNRHNLKHSLSRRGGYLAITEGNFQHQETRLKVGGFYHSGNQNWSIHLNGSQQVWQSEDRTLEIFSMLAFAPRQKDEVTCNLAGGINLNGVFARNRTDFLGLAASSIALHGHGWETAVELQYRCPLREHFYVAPDIQFIINPQGENRRHSALVLMTRFGISL